MTGPESPEPAPLDLIRLRHDFRTPLNAILGYGEMLLEEAQDRGFSDLAVDAERLLAEGRRLLAGIAEIFSSTAPLTRLEAARRARARLRPGAHGVVALCQLWMDQLDDVEALELTSLVFEATHRLLDLIEGLAPDSSVRSQRLPLRPDEAGGPALGALLSTSTMEAVDTATGRILVVDDTEMNRDVLRRRLERLGNSVELAEGGRAALRAVEERSFDLILLDLLMPGVSGIEVLETLKRHPDHRHTPVIVVSSLDELSGIVRCLEIGAEDYLARPFHPAILEARIHASLERKALRDAEVANQRAIGRQKTRVDELLHALFPPQVVTELKETGTIRPRRYEDVAVLFADVVGFTAYSEQHDPEDVVANLQALVAELETACEHHGLLKAKTIGDAIMASAGLLGDHDRPAARAVACGLEMTDRASRLSIGWQLRVGIHVGPVVAGVVGRRQYAFDLWGDTVNTAARLESVGATGAVTVSEAVWQRTREEFVWSPLGSVELRGRGDLALFETTGRAGDA